MSSASLSKRGIQTAVRFGAVLLRAIAVATLVGGVLTYYNGKDVSGTHPLMHAPRREAAAV